MIKALLLIHKNWDTIWNKIKEIFSGVLSKIVSIYNATIAKIPGIAKIDMEKVEASLLAVKDTAEVTGEGFGQASTIMSDNADRMAKRIGDSSVRIVTSSSSVAVAVEGDSVKIVEAQDAAKAAVEALAEANRKAAEEFWDKSIDMRWNLSETGIAWQDLGGSVESIVGAMAATTGQSELSIIASFEGMRREGETWKDLLLRLEKEGVINLDKLGGAMNALEADTRRAKEEAEKLNRILGANVDEIRGIAEELNRKNDAIRRDRKIEELRQQKAAAAIVGKPVSAAHIAGAGLFKTGEAQEMLAFSAKIGAVISEGAIDAMVAGATDLPTVQPNLFKPGAAQGILTGQQLLAAAGSYRPFAKGVRNFRGGRALVGEEGPELVDLPRGSNVTPNNQMGGSTVNINFNGPVYGVDDFNEKVNQARLAWETGGERIDGTHVHSWECSRARGLTFWDSSPTRSDVGWATTRHRRQHRRRDMDAGTECRWHVHAWECCQMQGDFPSGLTVPTGLTWDGQQLVIVDDMRRRDMDAGT